MVYLLIAINVVLLVLGQVLWKYGISQTGFELSAGGLWKIVQNWYIVSGMLVYILATFIWLYILSQKELSSVYPLQSLCYIVALLAGVLIFKETAPANKWLGVLLITAGAYMINRG